MPRIPHVGGTNATMGRRGPDRIGPYSPDTRGMTQAADALGGVARAVAQTTSALAGQFREEKEQLARVKASNALLDDEMELAQISADIQNRMADGSLTWSKAEEEFQTRLSLREAREIEDLDPVAREQYTGGLARNRSKATFTVQQAAVGAMRADFGGQIVSTFDRLGKIASDPNADMDKIVAQGGALRDLAGSAGLGERFDKMLQDFSDRAYSDNARARLIVVREDMAGLQQLERDLTEDDGRYTGKLDADKRNAILSQVMTAQGQLEERARREADKGEAEAARALTKFEAQVSSGIPAPIDTMAEWSEAIGRGTPEQQTEFRTMLGQEVEIRRVLTLPPEQQQQYVAEMRAKQSREGATLVQQANLRRLSGAVEAGAKQLRENPLGFHMERTGATVAPLDLQSALSGDFGPLQQQASERMTIIAAMRKQYGPSVGDSPLLPGEVAALSAALARSKPETTLKLFGTLMSAFGDERVYAAAVRQIAPKSPIAATAGVLYAKQQQAVVRDRSLFSQAVTVDSESVAETLLEGQRILAAGGADGAKGSAFPMPPPKQLADAFAAEVGTAFRRRPQTYESSLQAVRAYYAGKANKTGNVSGELDAALVAEAVRAVIGEPVSINGADVFPPWGMSGADFEDKIEQAWTEAVIGDRVNGVILPKATPTLPDGVSADFGDYTLQQLGDGRYYVVNADGEYLHTARRVPLILTVK